MSLTRIGGRRDVAAFSLIVLCIGLQLLSIKSPWWVINEYPAGSATPIAWRSLFISPPTYIIESDFYVVGKNVGLSGRLSVAVTYSLISVTVVTYALLISTVLWLLGNRERLPALVVFALIINISVPIVFYSTLRSIQADWPVPISPSGSHLISLTGRRVEWGLSTGFYANLSSAVLLFFAYLLIKVRKP